MRRPNLPPTRNCYAGSRDAEGIVSVITLVKFWHSLTVAFFSHYHPELHYMRGPGPKCREKLAHRVLRP